MKYSSLIWILLIFSNCQGQTKLIQGEKLITDWSVYPCYSRLTEEVEGKTKWKKSYEYLDDIDVSFFGYLSDGLKITGIIAKPKKAGNYPCIIYNRGGNREFGSLTAYNGASRMGKIAKEGYVVIASQYRGGPRSEGQEEFGGKDVNDVLNLIKVLAEIEIADTDKIGMYGWSRGAMMTYIALTKTDKIKVAVTGAGRSDLTIIDRPEMDNIYAELIPNYATNKEAELKKRSAIYLIDKFPKNVPILMLHGTSDSKVKSTNSLKLALEFEKYRIPYRLKIFEGGDHGLRKFRQEVDEEVISWFNRYLKNNEPLPNMEFHGR